MRWTIYENLSMRRNGMADSTAFLPNPNASVASRSFGSTGGITSPPSTANSLSSPKPKPSKQSGNSTPNCKRCERKRRDPLSPSSHDPPHRQQAENDLQASDAVSHEQPDSRIWGARGGRFNLRK